MECKRITTHLIETSNFLIAYLLYISGPHLQIGSQQLAYGQHAILGLTI